MYKMLSAQGMHINYCDDVWPTLLYQVLFTMTPFLPIMNVDISHIRDFVFKLSLLPPPKKKNPQWQPQMASSDRSSNGSSTRAAVWLQQERRQKHRHAAPLSPRPPLDVHAVSIWRQDGFHQSPWLPGRPAACMHRRHGDFSASVSAVSTFVAPPAAEVTAKQQRAVTASGSDPS